ncbi:hypothetical protein ACK3SF_01025 [Candidatus Nanosalina sp. VS9-1]|uniref:hypothetical protein n=1 Tax=Candidatus Nanosalina sp. VS9-1 TaxID=3388566 RepID=UPI0039E10158
MTGNGPVRIGQEVEKFVNNPGPVLRQVESFRQKLDRNLEKVLQDAEKGIENSLLGHPQEPEVYPIFTPELTEVGEDRLLIALSIALFELANPSSDPLHRKLENTSEASVGKTAEGLLNGFRNGQFNWSAKYEKEDNSMLFNEIPEKQLPPSTEAPDILAFLWNGLNSSIDAGVDRNYGIGLRTLEANTVHEMTHALNTQATTPLKNSKTEVIDEASAMASTYVVGGKMPDEDYSDEGLNQRELEQARKILGRFVDEKGHRKETVSLIRNISIRSIQILADNPGHDTTKVLENSINQL